MADNQMHADDIIVNDSEALGVYDEATDPIDDRVGKEETSKMNTTFPILEELLEWFELAIASCDSINNLDLKSEEKLRSQVRANQMVKSLLKQKRSQLVARFSNFQMQQPESDDESE